MWPTHVCASLRRKAKPLGLNHFVHVLSHRDSPCNLQAVIVPAKERIGAEIKVLFFAVARDSAGKSSAQTRPILSTLLPRRNFGHFEVRHRQQRWSGQIGPPGISVEVCAMK